MVGSGSGDGAAHQRLGGGGDLEVVQDEVCHEGGVLCHDEGEGVGGGDDGVIHRPVEEEVGGVLGGDEGGGVAVVVGSRAGDGSAVQRLGGGGDHIVVLLKEVVDGGGGLVVSNGNRVALGGGVGVLVAVAGGGAAVGTGIDLAAVVTLGIGVENVGVIDAELVLSGESDGGVGDAGGAVQLIDMSVHVAPAGDSDGDSVGRCGLAQVIHGGDVIMVTAHVIGQGAVRVGRVGRGANHTPVAIDVIVQEGIVIDGVPTQDYLFVVKYGRIGGGEVLRDVKGSGEAPRVAEHTVGAGIVALTDLPVVGGVAVEGVAEEVLVADLPGPRHYRVHIVWVGAEAEAV